MTTARSATAPAVHTVRWFGVTVRCEEFPDGRVPRNGMMRGRDWGWDAVCSCGWDSRTGGALEVRVREAIQDHRRDVRSA